MDFIDAWVVQLSKRIPRRKKPFLSTGGINGMSGFGKVKLQPVPSRKDEKPAPVLRHTKICSVDLKDLRLVIGAIALIDCFKLRAQEGEPVQSLLTLAHGRGTE